MKSVAARIAVVACVGVLALVFFVVALVQRARFAGDTEHRQAVETQISTLLNSLAVADAMPKEKQAAVLNDSHEESNYLTFLRTAAAETGVHIVRWTSSTPAAGSTPPPAPTSPALAGVTPMIGTLEVTGTYRAALAFSRRLESCDRLLNLTEVGWNRGDTAVHFSAQITRYVVSSTPAPASPSKA